MPLFIICIEIYLSMCFTVKNKVKNLHRVLFFIQRNLEKVKFVTAVQIYNSAM